MKSLTLIVFLTFLVVNESLSQNLPTHQRTLDVHLVPLPAIDYNPRWRFGVEYNTAKKLGFNVDVGLGNSSLNSFRLRNLKWGNDYSFIEIRPEMKFLMKRSESHSFYFSTELFFVSMHDVLLNDYYYKDGRIAISYDQADFNKTKYGFHFKTGVKFNLDNGLCFDLFGGLGLARRDIFYEDIINPGIIDYEIFGEWWGGGYRYATKETLLSATLGVKIGYLFLNK